MRTVLVKKQDIEVMIEHLEENYENIDMLLNTVEMIMHDEEWDILGEATVHLVKCQDILKSYMN
jgi:hypothetical protein